MSIDRAVTGEESVIADFFRLLEIDVDNVNSFPTAMDRLRHGELQAILVHEVLVSASLAPLVETLEDNRPNFIKTSFPDAFKSWFYGCNLNLCAPDLVDYFQSAACFNAQLRELAVGGQSITDQVIKTLSALDNGQSYQAPPGPAPGQHYMLTTLRAHETGGFIPKHFDNEQAHRPSYQHLMGLIQPRLISFVLCLAEAESGGELEVFNQLQPASGSHLVNDDHASQLAPDAATRRSVRFRIPPGAMIIVDSGRLLHSVTPVVGSHRRWVMCSFMAQSNDGRTVYCWG